VTGEEGKLGLKEVVAMGVGGMVSGGIYAALGVAMRQAGNAVPLSYLIAGLITLATAYTYVELTRHFDEGGGVVFFVERITDSRHVPALVGWVLVVGYVGVMALYAFAFGSYTLIAARTLFAVELPRILRPAISVAVVVAFVGLNLAGVEETGFFEDVVVYLKVALLLSLAGLGVAFFDGSLAAVDFFDKGYVSPVTGFAIIFVSYEGFQLLAYDYDDIRNPSRNYPLGMYAAVLIATAIYVSVSFMAALYLSPEQLIRHEETVLAAAVSNVPVLAGVGFGLVILSAMKSTSSGINATLFGASRLAHKVAADELMPKIFSFRDRRGIPRYALLVMGGLTAVFAALGTLEQITEFGSVVFLVADALANYAGLKLHGDAGLNPWIPGAGFVGTLAAIPLVLHHLYVTEFGVLVSIVGIFAAVVALELLWMEREPLGRVVEEVEREVNGRV